MIAPFCNVCLEMFEPGERVTAFTTPAQGTIWLCGSCADEMKRACRGRDVPYYDVDLERVGFLSQREGGPLSGNRAQRRARRRGR